MTNTNKYVCVHSLLNCRFSESTFRFFRVESDIVVIQPGRTIFKTFGAKRARLAVETSNTKTHKEESGSAAVRIVVAERLSEQVHTVLCGDQRGQRTSATIRPAIKIYIFIIFLFLFFLFFWFLLGASKYSFAGRVQPGGRQLNSPVLHQGC